MAVCTSCGSVTGVRQVLVITVEGRSYKDLCDECVPDAGSSSSDPVDPEEIKAKRAKLRGKLN